jgi:hypothetical protein
MKASAQILVQRYLDGDLSELELQAFLEDLSQSRELASMLEREVKLDAAVINDAYSIEPPAELRASILNVISTSETNWFGTAAGRATIGLAVSGLLLLTSFVGIGSDSERHSQSASAPEAQSAAPATASVMTPKTQPDLRPSTSIAAGVAQAPSSSTTDADDVISEIVIEPTSPLHEQFETLTRPLRDQPSVAVWGMSAPFGTSLPAGLFAGMVGTTAASLRYELDVLEGSQVFVEAGGLQQARTSIAYVNDQATSSITSQTMPFLSIGIGGMLVNEEKFGYAINGSVSIGITSTGPLALADVSASILDLGFSTIDLGLRFSTLIDVGTAQRAYFNAAPFVRMGIPLR